MVNGFNFANEEFLFLKSWQWDSQSYSYYYQDDDVLLAVNWEHLASSRVQFYSSYVVDMLNDGQEDITVYESPTLEGAQRQVIKGLFE